VVQWLVVPLLVSCDLWFILQCDKFNPLWQLKGCREGLERVKGVYSDGKECGIGVGIGIYLGESL
jgi:hypothetical protein